ncbi:MULTISPECIES: hypothetical protein [Asanoa]|uniref:Uncharacterized protein n=2 Tax=Asanoa TaxID=195964 RepID=A0A239PFF5_9ACTN|nr:MULTISPECIES: hypothetical protein [Asanoa]GIF74216.1 hypothetical protein Asi02nite_37340 [Asanoa siamensis]SNT65730.1 hypothetical protein SAMN05421812_12573 [Asanoa hainanensis]
MAQTPRTTAEVLAAHGFAVDPKRVSAATERLRSAQAGFAAESGRRREDALAWAAANDRDARHVA